MSLMSGLAAWDGDGDGLHGYYVCFRDGAVVKYVALGYERGQEERFKCNIMNQYLRLYVLFFRWLVSLVLEWMR